MKKETDIYGCPITLGERIMWVIEDWLAPILVGVVLFALVCVSNGCQSPVAKSQKTLASIQLTADAAMKVWGGYVAKEQRRADALPDGQREAAHAALLVKRLRVDDARTKFSRAWAAAWQSAKYRTEAVAPLETLSALTELQTLTAH